MATRYAGSEVILHDPLCSGEVANGDQADPHRRATRGIRPKTAAEIAFLGPGPSASTNARLRFGYMGEIETARLILRPVLRDDLDALARIYARPEVGRYTSRTGRITWERSEDIVEHSARLWEQYGYGPWTAIDRATGVIMGRVGLNLLADWPGPDKWEVGWELDPTFWARGLATEGGRVGVRLGFEAAGLDCIISAALAQNRASRRVMEKCGLNYKGTTPYHGTELVWYAISRREWAHDQACPQLHPRR